MSGEAGGSCRLVVGGCPVTRELLHDGFDMIAMQVGAGSQTVAGDIIFMCCGSPQPRITAPCPNRAPPRQCSVVLDPETPAASVPKSLVQCSPAIASLPLWRLPGHAFGLVLSL